MTNKEIGDFEAFKKAYGEAQPVESVAPINSSKFDLFQQLENFNNFSQPEEDSRCLDKEARVL